MGLNVENIYQAAAAELQKEQSEDAKKSIKTKLKQIAAAEKVVANLYGELEVLKADLAND